MTVPVSYFEDTLSTHPYESHSHPTSRLRAVGRRRRADRGWRSRPPLRRQLGAIRVPFEKYTLPNGLTIVLAQEHSTPTVAVEVLYHVGSKNETKGRTGFAHMFEHVMFTGSGHVPYGLHDKFTEGVGGNNNGNTTNDFTQYYEIIPSNYLEHALWLESDRMGWLLDALDVAKYNAQRDIVQNERRQSVDNQPYGASGRDHLGCDVSEHASVFVAGDRQSCRPSGCLCRRREGVLPSLLRAEQRDARHHG